MKCKIFSRLAVHYNYNGSMETEINEFLNNAFITVNDVRVVSHEGVMYVFIFYTETKCLKGDKKNV